MVLLIPVHKMLVWFFLLGATLASPVDEFRGFVDEGELALNGEKFFKYIIPSGYSPQKIQTHYKILLEDIVDKKNENYVLFNKYMEAGHTMKGLTFNIYDDNMRIATIALFRLLQNTEGDDFVKLREWAVQNVNKDMFEYAWRLMFIYKNNYFIEEQEPPYITKPNYFINAETIKKALDIKVSNGIINHQEAHVNQIFKSEDSKITINSNYSGWNLLNNGCDEELNYFREDPALNSYYYGVHLLHPFWMGNEELDALNPRQAEHYYFTHQQLLARYNLEKEHLSNNTTKPVKCISDYYPYLSYDNGLQFPTRSSYVGDRTKDQNRIKAIDIAIRECISRGVIFMDNGTKISMNADNYVDLLAKLIRANFDSIKTAKIIKSLFGYAGIGNPVDTYNPAPSLLHHPETTLRDPIYWYLIQCLMDYFEDYKNTLEPFDLAEHETDDYSIIGHNFTKIITYFEDFELDLSKALKDDDDYFKKSSVTIAAKQRRLTHLPFTLNFTVQSKINESVIVRLFLGPTCIDNYCWREYKKFFELDTFRYFLEEGSNTISWSPDNIDKFSFDSFYNLRLDMLKKNRYDMFKFPKNLLIPKGLEQGLNLTLFVIITPADESDSRNIDSNPEKSAYKRYSFELDKKPLGFPFQREALIYENSNNYRFYNISVYHKKTQFYGNDYFSPQLI